MGTQFSEIYNRFLGKITDDMFLELTPEDTCKGLQTLLLEALPGFEFPRSNLYDYEIRVLTIPKSEYDDSIGFVLQTYEDGSCLIDVSQFNVDLTSEEINIIAILMMEAWLQRQITSIEHTRMKYSGSDFKMTSQANHLQKLLTTLAECQRQSIHMQRLYKRRERSNTGTYQSTWYHFGENSVIK